MPAPIQQSIRNRILAALPEDEFAIVATSLVPIHLQLGQGLHRAGDRIEHVYFPEIGFISALAVLQDGSPIEIGLIGAEGVAGVSVVLGATESHSETMCQTGGDAHRMSAAAFTQAIAAAPFFRALLLKYVHVFGVQVSQTTACNCHHELGQRLARWLLGAHDRSGVPELSLTQDLIAIMRAPVDRQHRSKHPTKGWRHPVSTWPDHSGGSRRARERSLRVLRGGGKRVSPLVRGLSLRQGDRHPLSRPRLGG